MKGYTRTRDKPDTCHTIKLDKAVPFALYY